MVTINQENDTYFTPPHSLTQNKSKPTNHGNNNHSNTNNYQNDMLDAYFMHLSDNLGLVIISLALNNFSYHS